MSSVTTLALRLVLPPLHCVTRPSGFTKLPLCLAPQRRAAQGTGLRAKARLAPKPCLAVKLSVAARCAAAGVSVSALARSHHEMPPPTPRAWRLQRPGRAGVARPPPKGAPSTRRERCYTALWHTVTNSPQLAMRCKPSKSVCTADRQRHLDSTRQGQALRVLRSLDVIVAWRVREGWKSKSPNQSFLAAAALRAAHAMRG